MDSLSATQSLDMPRPALVVLLAALAAVGQFASNIYLPSLPAVAQSFGVPIGAVQITLAVFLATFAVMQLVVGPLSDRFGRRPVLLAGLVVFLAGSGLCLVAETLALLNVGRAVQAAGAAAAFVISRAITRDLFSGETLARVMALVTMVFALVPGLTPLLGGLLQQAGGWRLTFVATVVFGTLVLVAVFRIVETNRTPLTRIDIKAIRAGYTSVLQSPVFLRFAVPSALVFASLSAFFAGSPAVYIDRLGVSPVEYGFYPPLTITGFFIGGIVTRRLVGRVPTATLAGIGLAQMVIASGVILLPPLAGLLHKHLFTAGMTLFVSGLGVFLPTAVAAALSPFPLIAGSAAAMLGFMQMAGGALGTILVSVLSAREPVLAFPLVMTVSNMLAIGWFAVGWREKTGSRISEAMPDAGEGSVHR